MYQIAICDDDEIVSEFIYNCISKYCRENGIDVNISTYNSGHQLFKRIDFEDNLDLLFLDIKLKEENGMDIGGLLREEYHNEKIQIVYISAYSEYAMKLFESRPFNFLIKPLKEAEIVKCFEKYLEIYKSTPKFFEYKVGKHQERIELSSIYYFCCDKRRIAIVTHDDPIYYYGRMKELREQVMAKEFWSVHNSYIINVNYVKKFYENEIVMCNGDHIPISHSYKEQVKKKLVHWR